MEIDAALEAIQLDGPAAVASVLPDLRELLEVERVLAYCPRAQTSGCFELGLFYFAGPPGSAPEGRRFERTLGQFLGGTSGRFGFYDVLRPERPQQNRVVQPTLGVPPEVTGQLRIASEVFRPMGVEGHEHLRALVCEADTLLAWFGAVHPGSYDGRQQQILAMLVPAIQRSLAAERRLGAAARVEATLVVALEAIAAPAFVLATDGGVTLANSAGRAMLERSRRPLMQALRDAAARRPASIACDLRPVRGGGRALGWIAIVRTDTPETRAGSRVAEAAARWSLTARQRQVLGLVVRGHATGTIAATLGISERAVEQHVTSLFDRAGVDTRAALVAAVLS